jgi:hypothetical protein
LFDDPVVTSKFSTMPPGGTTVVRELLPNRPSTSAPFTEVVTDGAAMRRVLAL